MKKINLNEFVWLGILVGYGGVIYYLFRSGKINAYIHPKMHSYVLLAMVVFGILALTQIGQIFNTKRNTDIKLGNFIFIIPLLCLVAIGPTDLGAKAISNKSVVLEGYHLEKSVNHLHNTLEAEQFKEILEALESDLEGMKDKEIELIGFVYKGKIKEAHEFALSRLMMSCCAADSWVQGIRCTWQDASALENNSWIKIKADIKAIMHYNKETKQIEEIPLLKVKSVEPIGIPEHPYIYY